MKIISFPSIFIAYVSIISLLSTPSCIEASNPKGFTIDLIHRDSPQSPHHDSSLSSSQRLANALQRSFHRIQRLANSPSPVSNVTSVQGEYLIEYSIGTPPVRSLGILDTGSDITWTQCQPCVHCFNQSLPIFQPKKSSTYRKVPCNSTICKTYDEAFCNPQKNATDKTCHYSAVYGDGSTTSGEIGSDTITFGSTTGKSVSFPNFGFGCGFDNGGIFSGKESGIVGLGSGKASLIRQLNSSVQGKFSYCMVPISSNPSATSKLNFGNNAVVKGVGVVSTPIVPQSSQGVFYALTLEGISVGNQRVELLGSKAGNSKEGNIIIDSGTTLTFLPEDFYAKLEKVVEQTIMLKRIPDPTNTLDLCYNSRANNVRVPDITVHFKGADLTLKAENTFVKTTNVSLCFGFRPQPDLAIYGNLAQANFLVGYDVVKNTVSFKPTDCTKLS